MIANTSPLMGLSAVGREASSLFALYRNVRAYPEPIRSALMEDLRRYVDEEAGPGWQEQQRGSADMTAQEAYWLAKFAGPSPVLDLPTDRPRPSLRTYGGPLV